MPGTGCTARSKQDCVSDTAASPSPKRVLLFGATGTIGRAVRQALLERGHSVVCPVRPSNVNSDSPSDYRACTITDPTSLHEDGFKSEAFDTVISCLASRTGAPADAWAIDHDAQVAILEAAENAGVDHFVLLSAICVQKPQLQFQFAKLSFEKRLQQSSLTYSIIRSTAYFKSLSGQVDRVRSGKRFMLFGDGALTACKPISDRDLGRYLVDCAEDTAKQNKILPIGGPGPAITPKDQGEMLFSLLGKEPRYQFVSIAFMTAVIAVLAVAGTISTRAANAAEFARIGRYYARESMLLWDPEAERYDADATPEYGSDTLLEHYRAIIQGEIGNERVDTAVF